MSRTVSDVPHPPLRNVDDFNNRLLAAVLKDTVFSSRAATWVRDNPGYERMDYLHLVLAPSRNAGTLPTLNNIAAYAAWVLTLPEPPPPPVNPEKVLSDYVNGA